jgi:HEAT repeat protein
MLLVVLLLLVSSIAACEQDDLTHRKVETAASAKPAQGSADSIGQAAFGNFISVEGADLKSKMEAAIKQARSGRSAGRFWTAYSFDVRPGVAVDPGIGQFSGTLETYGGTSIFIGTSNGMTVETRNLGVFLLRELGGSPVVRVEVYNLDRRREYSGYPVYWLGRAGNEESLEFLKGLAGETEADQIAERATVAIGLHDDRRVGAMLKDLVRQSSQEKVRHTALFWLGQVGGEQAFLADLARNGRESSGVRRQAVFAIGMSKDTASLSLLQDLYRAVTQREVREQVISSAARTEDKEAAVKFLIKIVESDPDQQLRAQAISRLGRLPGAETFLASLVRNERESDEVRKEAASALGKSSDPAALSTLQSLYRSLVNRQVKEQIISAAAKIEDPKVADFLTQVARSETDHELRKQAISRLGRLPGTQSFLANLARNEQEEIEIRRGAVSALRKSEDATAFSTLQSLYDAVASREVKAEIINTVSKGENTEAAASFLIKISRSDPDHGLREEAILRLGRLGCPRCLQALIEVINNPGAETGTQIQAVSALGKGSNEGAVTLLIEVAKSHPRAEVRQEAIRRLRHRDDERVQKFLKELISK